MTNEQLAYQAKEVRLLMQHEATERAWKATRDRITEEWKQGRDPLAREMCWHKQRVFEEFLQEMRKLTDPSPNGRMALTE